MARQQHTPAANLQSRAAKGWALGPDMSMREVDCAVLCQHLAIHKDAEDFYGAALEKAGVDTAQRAALKGLQELHGRIVGDVGARVKAAEFAPEMLASSCTCAGKYFSELKLEIPRAMDEKFLQRIRLAEERALLACEAGMEEGASVETQLFLAEQLGLFSHASEHLKLLGSAVKGRRRH
ncbi:MAG: hypothetical protein GC185_10420 [Alphaproteobacteria bacterium]|nr:hypothetical protein [Alphaproteobacteria bacterium]